MKAAVTLLLSLLFALALGPAAAENRATFKPSQTVGVLFTDATQLNLSYLRAYHEAAQQGVGSRFLDPTIQQAYADSSDPQLAVDWLANSLGRHFASVKFYGSLETLMAAHPDVVVMLDTRSHLVNERSADVTASVRAEFYDSQLNYLGKAEGTDARSLSTLWLPTRRITQIADDIAQQKTVQENALRQFDGALGKLVKAPRKLPEAA